MNNVVEAFGKFEFAARDMKEIVPKLSIQGHGFDNTGLTVFAMKVRKKIIGKTGGAIDKRVVGPPMMIELKRAAETDAVGMFVHTVKKEATEEDPSRRSRATALALAMDGRLV